MLVLYRCWEMVLDNYFAQLGNLGNWIWAIWVKCSVQTNLTQTITLNAYTKEIITLKSLWPNLIKIITLNANTKRIIVLDTVY